MLTMHRIHMLLACSACGHQGHCSAFAERQTVDGEDPASLSLQEVNRSDAHVNGNGNLSPSEALVTFLLVRNPVAAFTQFAASHFSGSSPVRLQPVVSGKWASHIQHVPVMMTSDALLMPVDAAPVPTGTDANESAVGNETEVTFGQTWRQAFLDPYKIAIRVRRKIGWIGIWSCLILCMRLLSVRRWSISWILHSLLGGILGLLLAFRTNQAWTRYWSAAQAWAEVHRILHNLCRLSGQILNRRWKFGAGQNDLSDTRLYSSLVRHLISLPIAIKQRVRNQEPDLQEYYESSVPLQMPAGPIADEYFWPVLLPSEAEIVAQSSCPHLVLLSTLSILIQPLKAKDDGYGKSLTLWSQMETQLCELQKAVAALDLVAKLPPPASYMTHTERFILLWVATLPFVLMDMINPFAVPLVIVAVAWALYSTEELAKLLDEPFAQPEAVPVQAYCDLIVSELQEQVKIFRSIQQNIDSGNWAVTPKDFEEVQLGTGTSANTEVDTNVQDADDDNEDDDGDLPVTVED
mmetsp:Transcript_159574/g.306343  ORF Transcript_159574/g.306343 Transcript_159574/m.306343 type:complete len:521 (-) Transcript_159574:101-1663(-)